MTVHARVPDREVTPRPKKRMHRFAVMLFWLSVIVVGALSITPVEKLPPQSLNIWDKAQHAIGFLWLTLTGLLAHPPHRSRIVFGLLAYGVFIELAQAATGWRHGDLADWLADAVGVVFGALAFRLWLLRADSAK